MICKFTSRLLRETDLRLLWKFSWNFGWKGMRAVQRFQRRKAKGKAFPAFLFISVTDRCNLSCQGCWVTPCDPARELDAATLDRIISACREQGSYFFGILGGEPLLHAGLFEVLAKYPDCYFLLFTNGLLITEETAREMRRIGNISPLISIEGSEQVSDVRRGGSDVHSRTMRGLDHCRAARLVTGVATSVCRSNIDDLASESFVNELISRGVHYLWYYIYRPVGPNPAPELALTREQVRMLREFMVEIRTRAPLLVVDAYWDHEGRALCPAAVGIGHHIGPGGAVEPCPPVQFSCDNVNNGDIVKIFEDSSFLANFRERAAKTTRGCIIMEDPDGLRSFLAEEGATDSSGRGTGFEELAAMTCRASHDMMDDAIPERNRMYRFAKKHWFFGFGAYG